MGLAAGIAAAGVAVSAGSAIAGAAGGSQKSGGSSTEASNAPWSVQQPYIQDAFNAAQNAYGVESSVPYPTQWTAQENPLQTGATSALYNMGMGVQDQYAPWQTAAGNLAGTQPQYTQNATGVAQNGIGAMSPATQMLSNYAGTGQMPGESQVNPNLAASLTGAATGSIGSLNQGSTAAAQVAQQAMNPNGALNAGLQSAAAYSQNPTLAAAIQAANTNTNLGLTENTLPQIRAQAMQDGNANSSREGALEGLATQSAQLADANTSAQMTSAAYNNGAALGTNSYNQNLNTALGGANALTNNGGISGNLLNSQQGLQQGAQQFGVSSQLSAANQAASQALGYQTANTSAMLAGNAQLGSGMQMGLQDQNSALAANQAGLMAAQGAGTYQQQQIQNYLNNNLDQYNFLTTQPSNLVNQYYNIVGTKQGQVSNSTSTPNNGGLGGALAGGIGGLSAGAGLSKNLGLDGSGNQQIGSFSDYLNQQLGNGSGNTNYNPANVGQVDPSGQGMII